MALIEIVRVVPANLHLLRELSIRTFTEAFAADNNEQDMAAYLASAMSEERLAAELADANSQFCFACIGGEPVGYLKLNVRNAQTENFGPHTAEIERIYVLPQHQRAGVGQALLGHALSLAAQWGAQLVWLGVWEHNARAIAFYVRNGFEPFGSHKFLLGSDEQTDILMRRSLVPGVR